MAIIVNEQGQVKIGGRVVRKRNPEERATVGAPPKLAGRLEYAVSLAGFDAKHDANMQNNVKRDDEFLRDALADFEDAVREAYVKAMTPAVTKVKNVMADPRFTNEARRDMAKEAIAPARAEWVKAASKYLADIQNGLRDIENLLLLALEPETEGMTPEVVEARARECREAVLSMPEPERGKLLLDLGEKAALEPLHALKSDPLKRQAARPEVLTSAREAAIVAQDGEWLLFDWKQQKRVLEAASARLAMMEVGTRGGLQQLGVDYETDHGAEWVQVVGKALAKSEKVLV